MVFGGVAKCIGERWLMCLSSFCAAVFSLGMHILHTGYCLHPSCLSSVKQNITTVYGWNVCLKILKSKRSMYFPQDEICMNNCDIILMILQEIRLFIFFKCLHAKDAVHWYLTARFCKFKELCSSNDPFYKYFSYTLEEHILIITDQLKVLYVMT